MARRKNSASMERERCIALVILSLRKKEPWRKVIGAVTIRKEIPHLSRDAIERCLRRCAFPGRLKPPFITPFASLSQEERQSLTRTSRKSSWT